MSSTFVCSSEEHHWTSKWLLAKWFDPNTIKLGSRYATGCKIKFLNDSYWNTYRLLRTLVIILKWWKNIGITQNQVCQQ